MRSPDRARSPRRALRGFLAGLALLGPAAARADDVAVIAHRGAHTIQPENTLAAVQAAIDMGADFVELDVRTSADGELVLMHDASVDRTTDGRGRVSRLTLAELRELDASARSHGGPAGMRIPTFDEALALARGCIGVYVDAKAVRAAPLVAALERHHMVRHSVIYGSLWLLHQVQDLQPQARVMPEAWNSLDLMAASRLLDLRVVAFTSLRFRPLTVALARSVGFDIFVDRRGGSDGPHGWQDAIDRGATGLQTDHPQALLDYLRERGRGPGGPCTPQAPRAAEPLPAAAERPTPAVSVPAARK